MHNVAPFGSKRGGAIHKTVLKSVICWVMYIEVSVFVYITLKWHNVWQRDAIVNCTPSRCMAHAI
jgi:hypothetical protein